MEHDSLGVRDGLTGWVSSCLTVADELATSLRTGDIGPFNVGRSLPSLWWSRADCHNYDSALRPEHMRMSLRFCIWKPLSSFS
ncbi:uncharacterized protein LOC121048854 isoform X4 [Rosa chinensis]|uniref:uncharacterized protein LOC121048854 isoform X4 n=1 Tax=Rosa chinensis TaxID=74649 RepID=UPI000D097634|nr:uncharacterized protein LOC121048854 isoform X4 [Rosa chinensis]XP_024186649.1 uncharacterized protein LOC121048854 isoform X4 [Rosa chinensis]XP_040372049.1 uncharacterized protein LOC121048854 isoform X4 [Rosa chinensis]XP_040372050.1 uncharacterized protein LOC121048854 isoform X4 [Rosa chinensis]XP_040372051.1 uncharacterized protein LOC121048854 isoform X4 [Rosa chinensis]XP_040372052.1 uncharacterized protein LOC121048854 isoform X4 [Rosa chinensis]XP_040372053.1 uncharacterized prot